MLELNTIFWITYPETQFSKGKFYSPFFRGMRTRGLCEGQRVSHTRDNKLVFLFKQTTKSNWIKQNQLKTKSNVIYSEVIPVLLLLDVPYQKFSNRIFLNNQN